MDAIYNTNYSSQPNKPSTINPVSELTQAKARRTHRQGKDLVASTPAEAVKPIKDEFLSFLSHELRTPLNPILGWSQLLRRSNCDEATLVKGLETIERNVKLQIELIDRLVNTLRLHSVELHQDMVALKNSNSTFDLSLSLAEIYSLADGQLLENPPKLNGKWILLVDNDHSTLEFMVFALQQYGANVIATASASEGLTMLAQLQFDLLLSNIGMPEMDGYTFIRKVRSNLSENGGQIPAIALTAYSWEEDRQLALEAGFQSHLTKPIDLLQLVKLVSRLVN
jgi:CheY-like chemotaxis protein